MLSSIPDEFFAETEPVVGIFHRSRAQRPQGEVGYDGIRESFEVGIPCRGRVCLSDERCPAEYLKALYLSDGARFEYDGCGHAVVEVHLAVVARPVVGGEYEQVPFREIGIEDVGAVGPAFGGRRCDGHDMVTADEPDDAPVYPVVRMFFVGHLP